MVPVRGTIDPHHWGSPLFQDVCPCRQGNGGPGAADAVSCTLVPSLGVHAFPGVIQQRPFHLRDYLRATRDCKLFDFTTGQWLRIAEAA